MRSFEQQLAVVHPSNSFLGAVALVLALLVLAGCGDGQPEMIPIQGEVTYNGKPLTEGTVHYMPRQRGEGQQASGGIGPDGEFQMTTRQRGDGVKPGEYLLSVYAMAPHPGEPTSREEIEAMGGKIERGFLIPEKYTDPQTSGLTDTVDANHSGFKSIELTD